MPGIARACAGLDRNALHVALAVAVVLEAAKVRFSLGAIESTDLRRRGGTMVESRSGVVAAPNGSNGNSAVEFIVAYWTESTCASGTTSRSRAAGAVFAPEAGRSRPGAFLWASQSSLTGCGLLLVR
jgi:hypothetical protein